MQKAYKSLTRSNRERDSVASPITTTDLYVRFLPKDSADINRLLADSLELFDFPLDYKVIEYGAYYHDPLLPQHSALAYNAYRL